MCLTLVFQIINIHIIYANYKDFLSFDLYVTQMQNLYIHHLNHKQLPNRLIEKNTQPILTKYDQVIKQIITHYCMICCFKRYV